MSVIWKREFRAYFYTPVGYVFLGVFLVVSSVLFYLGILQPRSGDLPTLIGEMSYLWMLVCPVLTMRLLAEEKQKKTDQLLLTSPVPLTAIVAGKYLAAISMLLATTLLTLCFAGVVAIYGKVYPLELAVNLLGFFLLGCAFTAVDLFLGSLASSATMAAMLAFGANFLLWILDLLQAAVPAGFLSEALAFCSLYNRNEPFLLGQLSFASVFFDLSFAFVFLMLTVYRMRSGRGIWPALRLGAVIAALVVLNLAGTTLEKQHGWRLDASFNGITTQSAQTREALAALEQPVHIYAFFRKGEEDAALKELLDRYAAQSPLVTWEQVDPALNPALVSRFSTDSVTVEADSLVVTCEKTNRFRVLGPEDYVALSMDEETGTFDYAGWTYERSLTGAIAYVSRETVDRVALVQGHGELDGTTLEPFTSLLEANQVETVWVDLSDAGFTPGERDVLVFFCPMRDLSEAELTRLTDFASHGGSFLFVCDYTDPLAQMPRYGTLLRSWGIVPLEGIVVAEAENVSGYYNGNRIYLLPEMLSTDITLDLIASGADTLLLPGARAFETPGETDRNLTAAEVVRMGEAAYLKQMQGTTLTMDREEGDTQGPFTLAVEARRVTSEGYVSRAFAMGCSALWTSEQVMSMTDSPVFLLRVLGFLLDTASSGNAIPAKEALRPALSPRSTALGSVLLAALPAAVLAAALLVLIPRKNR